MMNTANTQYPKLTFFTKIKMAIVAGVILCVGFMTSIFVLAISAIMLPFVTIGMWILQKRVREQFDENFHQDKPQDTMQTEDIQPEEMPKEAASSAT